MARTQRLVLFLVASLSAGFVFGFAAWGEGRAPALAVLLGFFVAVLPKRIYSATFVGGYVLALLRTHPAFLAGWFDGQMWLGWLICVGYAAISGLFWSVGWSQQLTRPINFISQQSRRVAFMSAAWVFTLLPPMAAFIPGHPLVGWGYITPGWAWFGVAASLLGPMALMLLWFRLEHCPWSRISGLVVVLLALVLTSLQPMDNKLKESGAAVAVSTTFGKVLGADRSLHVMEEVGGFIRKSTLDGVTYFWPESVIGFFDPSYAQVMSLEVLEPALSRKQTQVIGMDIRGPDGFFKSVAVAYYPDGSHEIARARQPAPVSLWRPWSNESFDANWLGKHDLHLMDGRRAAVLFCYEEFIPGLFLLSVATVNPDLFVAMSNTWASPSTTATNIQSYHSIGMARLFGIPFIKAENRPTS